MFQHLYLPTGKVELKNVILSTDNRQNDDFQK